MSETFENKTYVWKEFLKNIKENVNPMAYSTWFVPIQPVELDNVTLKVKLPSQFFWEWIDEHYSGLISQTLNKVLGPDAKLSYIISDSDKHEIFKEGLDKPVKEEEVVIPIKTNGITLTEPEEKFESNLNQRYTFENFIKGDGNQLACAAAGAISNNPGGTTFNPLFIYGGVGLGKTHLIQAIGNKILQDMPGKKVIYIPADSFTTEFVDAILGNKRKEFSDFYKRMDVLIIDDIQFLVGKEKTQEYFFHIFNTLHQSSKQIILSSDKPPKDIKGLDDRLISRFQWGLTADIQPPDLETRIAILRRKIADYGMVMTNEIIEYIANTITSNIRELEGCLIKLLASASLNSKVIDIELVKRVVKEIATDRKINITIEHITKTVCQTLKIDENHIRDKTRKKEVVVARQLAMYLAKELTGHSLKSIGLSFGGRDHSTVIHACTSVEEQLLINKKFKELYDELRNQIEISSL